MKRLAAALGLCVAAGCSGGGGGPVSAPAPIVSASPTGTPSAAPTSTAAPKQTLAAGSATIFIPNVSKPAAANRRSSTGMLRGHTRGRLYVSPSTQSVSIAATAADGFLGYVITAVPANSPNCTPVTGGRSCTLAFNAPPGIDTIQIIAYDYTDAYNGAPLAIATVPNVNIAAQGKNTFTFTLGGIVGQPPVLSPATFNVVQGTPQDLTLTIQGDDFDGNPITTYDAPLSIAQTDKTGNFTLSATSIADSSVTPSIVVHYNGGTAPTTITVAATSTNTIDNYGPQTSTITITPTPLTGLFVPSQAAGVDVYSTATGALLGTFASSFGANLIAMDNDGGVYVANAKNQIAKFSIAGTAPLAYYTPTGPNLAGSYLIALSPKGTLFAASVQSTSNSLTETVDEWDAGKTGSPSRTVARTSQYGYSLQTPAVGPDGSLYLCYFTADGGQAIDEIAPGSTTVTQTISLPTGFSEANAVVGPSGTLYVAENDFTGQDSLAGLYVYPPAANSFEVTNGAPFPTAIDVDDAGDVYVVNSNSASTDSGLSDDTVHLYTEFTPGALSIVRQVNSGFSDAQSLTVSGDGSMTYLQDFGTKNAAGGIVKLVPTSTSGITISMVPGGNAVLFDGTRAKAIRTGRAAFGFGRSGRFTRLRHR